MRSAERGTLNSIPARRISDAVLRASRNVRHRLATIRGATRTPTTAVDHPSHATPSAMPAAVPPVPNGTTIVSGGASSCVPSSSARSEEHTSELQSRGHLVCRLLLEKKKKNREFRMQV